MTEHLNIHGFHERPERFGELAHYGADAPLLQTLMSKPDLARTLALQLDDFSHIRVTCEAWRIADRLREWLPELKVSYSIRSARQLRGFIRDVDAERITPTHVTVRHSLLRSRGVVEALRQRAGRVGAWTVDDVERALQLKNWGVDAIVSNQLTVLNSI